MNKKCNGRVAKDSDERFGGGGHISLVSCQEEVERNSDYCTGCNRTRANRLYWQQQGVENMRKIIFRYWLSGETKDFQNVRIYEVWAKSTEAGENALLVDYPNAVGIFCLQ